MPEKQPIQAEDLYNLKQIGPHVRLSPDGEWLVYPLTQADEDDLTNYTRLFATRTDGSETRQLTRGEVNDSSPEYSPDGTQLAFISARDEHPEIWLLPLVGGEAEQLTDLKGKIYGLDWHPDGDHIYFTYAPPDAEEKERRERKQKGEEAGVDSPKVRLLDRPWYRTDGAGWRPEQPQQLWRVDVESGETEQLTEFEVEVQGFSVTPGGDSVLFTLNSDDEPDLNIFETELHRYDIDSGEVTELDTERGAPFLPRESPDGERIAYLAHPERHQWVDLNFVYLTDRDGQNPDNLIEELDRSALNYTINDTFGTGASRPVWQEDGEWLYFTLCTEGATELWRADPDSGELQKVLTGEGVLIDYAIDEENDVGYAAWSKYDDPGNLVEFDLHSETDGAEARQLTEYNEDWLEERAVRPYEEHRFEGSDGNELQGWVITPPDYDPKSEDQHPGILYIHGGPQAQYGYSFFHEFQYLAGQGHVVFFSNPRGGVGYTREHLRSIVAAWGTKDYEDLMAFTDFVLSEYPAIDEGRLGVAGGSYGGYMTNWIIGQTDRFAAANTQRCISNLVSFSGSSDFGFLWQREWDLPNPWTDPEPWREMSPMTYIDEMETPTLIVHSEHDWRCPLEQAQQLYIGLQLQDVDTELAFFPEESHGLSRGGRADRRIERLELIKDWFEKYLFESGGEEKEKQAQG